MRHTLVTMACVATALTFSAQARPGGGSYQGTRTGPAGQTSTVQRQNSTQRTGPNTWQRNGQQTVTNPNGASRTRQSSGTGSVNRTDNGYQKTYNGTWTNSRGNTTTVNRNQDVQRNPDGSITRDGDATYTNQNGKTLNVDSSSTSTKNADGTWTTDRDATVTNGQGQTLGTGQSTTTRTPGEGTQTTGSYQNQQGGTWQYDGSTTRVAPGQVEYEGTRTNPQGTSRTTTGTARWQYINGRWVRMGEVTTGTP